MTALPAKLRHPSIRLRITLAVTAAMTVAFAAIGLYVYDHTSRSLDHARVEALTARLNDTGSVVRGAQVADRVRELDFADRDNTFVQVVDARGGVLADSGELDGAEVLPRRLIDRASPQPANLTRVLERDDPPVVLRMQRLQLADREVVVIVGASTGSDARALQALRRGLSIGAAIAIALIAGIGYLAVALALRPVERIRREAAAITTRSSLQRLPVPHSRDELSHLAETLNAMLSRLDAGLQRERQLTADASHELRTPLALLKMELEVALAEATSTLGRKSAQEQVEHLLETIRSSEIEVDRLIQLAESLLLLARADQGELQIMRSDVDIRTLLRDLATRFAARASQDGRTITIDSPDLTISADPIRLTQALSNLVDNALRHGQGAITVHAQLRPPGELVINVRDEGPGIDPAFATHAFDRFTRAESSRTSAGAGLGLSIAQAIAAAHDGDVRIATTPDHGSSVELRLGV
ncbi:MAG: integral rane sensor signal transduction histidine kinase, partial [Thermoleophilia bacterium]|nr:integral rane sensor signal transduction histidine kinase [Thermoleophilia bacterium]